MVENPEDDIRWQELLGRARLRSKEPEEDPEDAVYVGMWRVSVKVCVGCIFRAFKY